LAAVKIRERSMITAIADFFGSLIGRVALAGGLFASFVAWRAWDIHQQRSIGAERIIQTSKAEGKKINEKNRAVTNRSEQPGAFDRLRRDSCRDC
jgi:hypothetical protein